MCITDKLVKSAIEELKIVKVMEFKQIFTVSIFQR